jgi:hypothetical protein
MRVRDRWLAAGALLGSAALFAGAPGLRADAFRDEKLGWSFTYPVRWNVIPVDAGDWLVARFESNREYEYYDRGSRDGGYHKPSIEVLVIPYPREAPAAPPAEGDGGAAPPAPAAGPAKAAPWKDLRDYLETSATD